MDWYVDKQVHTQTSTHSTTHVHLAPESTVLIHIPLPNKCTHFTIFGSTFPSYSVAEVDWRR